VARSAEQVEADAAFGSLSTAGYWNTDALLATLARELERDLRRNPEREPWTTANGGRSARLGEATCEGCGQPFTRDRADRRYHSDACRDRAYEDRRRERRARVAR
jgi:hypothetical protein